MPFLRLCQFSLWLRSVFEVAYAYGWRRSEIFKLKMERVSFLDRNNKGTIRLDKSKSGRPRIVTMTKKVRELLLACCSGKDSLEDFVFTRDGEPIVDYRQAWGRALKAAGINRHLLLHDLRRTAIRGMRDRGVDRKVAMLITGHETESCYSRYNIIDLDDIEEAIDKLDAEQNSHTSAIQQPSQHPQEEPLNVEVTLPKKDGWWAHQDSNLGPTDYESAALTN